MRRAPHEPSRHAVAVVRVRVGGTTLYLYGADPRRVAAKIAEAAAAGTGVALASGGRLSAAQAADAVVEIPGRREAA